MVGLLFRKIATEGLLVLLLIVAGFSTAIYGFGVSNNFTRNFARSIPLPAAKVGADFVLLWKVDALADAYQHAVNSISNPAPADLSGSRKSILDKLIRDTVVTAQLKQRKALPPQSEIDEYYVFLLVKFGVPREQAGQEIRRRFGLSEIDFKNLIVWPDYAEKKLAQHLNAEASDSREYQRAAKIKELLDSGEDFAKTAAVYSEDEDSRHIGGDLGFMQLEGLDPWLKAAVEKINVGQTSDVVAGPDGYHILKIANKDEESQPARFQVRHILVKGADIEQYIDGQIPKYRIYTFGKF